VHIEQINDVRSETDEELFLAKIIFGGHMAGDVGSRLILYSN